MPLAATIPNSPRSPRTAFTVAVRCRTRSERTRWSVSTLWLCRDLIGTNRMFGRPTASQIASASAASVLFLFT